MTYCMAEKMRPLSTTKEQATTTDGRINVKVECVLFFPFLLCAHTEPLLHLMERQFMVNVLFLPPTISTGRCPILKFLYIEYIDNYLQSLANRSGIATFGAQWQKVMQRRSRKAPEKLNGKLRRMEKTAKIIN